MTDLAQVQGSPIFHNPTGRCIEVALDAGCTVRVFGDDLSSSLIPCPNCLDKYQNGSTIDHEMSTLVEQEVIETSMSALDTFSRCRRKYFYQEVLGWIPRVATEPMEMGTLYHASLAAGYRAVREYDRRVMEGALKNRTDNDRALAFIEAAVLEAGNFEYDRDGKKLQLTSKQRTLVEDMVRYRFQEVGERDLLNIEEVISVEEPFYLQVGRYLIRSTLDAVVKYFDQPSPMIKDHKTGDPEEGKGWIALDVQTREYYVAARGKFGHVTQFSHEFSARDVPPGFGHRSELTDTGRKRSKETLESMKDPKRYISAWTTELSDAQLDAALVEIIETIQEIDHCKETGRWTRSRIKVSPMACTKCPYFETCKAELEGKPRMTDEFASQGFLIRGSDEWKEMQANKK